MRNDIRHPHGAFSAPGRARWLHVARDARSRFGVGAELFGLRGRVMFGDVATAHRLAARMNAVREAARYPELAVGGSELYGAALLHELMHAVVETVSLNTPTGVFAPSVERVAVALGREALTGTLRAFVERFPAPPVATGRLDSETYLLSDTEGTPNTEVVLEEALLVWLANANPALERLRELFDDAPLRATSAYGRALPVLEDGLREHGPTLAGGISLIDLLWAPQRRSPTSLEGQLMTAQELWAPLLGERYAGLLARLLRSVDALREEHRRGPVGPGPVPVLDAEALAGAGEFEAFSPDSDWMPRVVMVAKSTYVWLAQLERRFQREIRRLDQIPDEALDELGAHGFNALWLIGLWERSEASRRIKQRRGQSGALASAYALFDYVVAADLGGETALRELGARAARRGIRLAGDMVPNHVGIDGRWVAEHPDWFVQLDHAPYPGYRFDGPDLSSHPAMAVVIEDHYWDDSDAAVVFKRVDRSSGEARYLYHGNDGTAMPWNDTAQLDYLKPEVREAVIQTILHVARTVPIIRFDAAMTLAKRHIQRLWYPPPGHGGAIPSRSAYGGMPAGEFERRMPLEFWREVVDRVSVEAPGTLLLAEAFWMMEGYFVRTLGMHRVYNSAFMNMLKREENADYRRLVKNVLEFDPRILGRFVNFMNNPDEETAIAQFGDGDKYFGVAILMATMPGLPMFGHGQVEGFHEKYGMEYRAPTFEEQPNAAMVERHRRQIAPLLHRRAQFASAETFRLYDAWSDGGTVIEDVFAYSNLSAGAASLVLYNNRYDRAAGTIHRSVPFSEPWNGGAVRDERLHAAVGVVGGAGRFTVLRERLTGLDYLRRSDDLVRDGFRFALDGFEAQVFTEVLEVTDQDGSYAGLHDELAGAGVPDLEEVRLDWLRRVPRERFLALLAAVRDGGDVEAAAMAFVVAAAEHVEGGVVAAAGVEPGPAGGRPARDVATKASDASRRASARPTDAGTGIVRRSAAHAVASALLGPPPTAGEEAVSAGVVAGMAVPDAAVVALTRAGVPAAEAGAWGLAAALRAAFVVAALAEGEQLYEELRLRGALASALASEGVSDAWAAARLPTVLVRLQPPGSGADASLLLNRVAADAVAQEFLGVHHHAGERWFRQEAFRLLAAAAVALAAARGAPGPSLERMRQVLEGAERVSGYRFDVLVAAGSTRDASRHGQVEGAATRASTDVRAGVPGSGATAAPRSEDHGEPTSGGSAADDGDGEMAPGDRERD